MKPEGGEFFLAFDLATSGRNNENLSWSWLITGQAQAQKFSSANWPLISASHGGDQKILPVENRPRTIVYDLRAKYNFR
jgi:hypothetical protein